MPILATFEGHSLSRTHCIRIQINVTVYDEVRVIRGVASGWTRVWVGHACPPHFCQMVFVGVMQKIADPVFFSGVGVKG